MNAVRYTPSVPSGIASPKATTLSCRYCPVNPSFDIPYSPKIFAVKNPSWYPFTDDRCVRVSGVDAGAAASPPVVVVVVATAATAVVVGLADVRVFGRGLGIYPAPRLFNPHIGAFLPPDDTTRLNGAGGAGSDVGAGSAG